jgi:phosphopantothenate-cysteine ligase
MATAQGVVVPIKCIEADSVHEVYAEMERLVPEHDVVIHAMAVSDFTFDSDAMVKIKSTDIDSLRKVFMESMKVAPKILPMIKKWNSAIILIGFKFEVGVSYDRLIEIARGQMLECHCDLVLANDKEEIKKANSHIGYILSKDPDEGIIRCRDKKNIAHMLLRQIKANLW